MKKKKNSNTNGKLKRCHICLNQYQSQNLDKHMHSRAHHEAIERLKGREQAHVCWACGVSLPGLEQFSLHIETKEHNSKLFSLKQRRESGFTLDYDNGELAALCAQRDQQRSLLKLQKHKEKLKRRRERKAAKFREASDQESQVKDKIRSTPAKGFSPNRSHAAESKNNEGAQTVGWDSFCSGSIAWSVKEDVDFTSDQLAPSECFPSYKEYVLQRSQRTSREPGEAVLDRKRSCDGHTSDYPPVKKQCLRAVKPRFTITVSEEKVEIERFSQSTSTAAPIPAPGLVQGHMDHVSIMLKSLRKSLEEERLPAGSSEDPDPELKPVADDGLKRNEHGGETAPSDVPRFSEKRPRKSEVKRLKSEAQACESKRESSPHKHPASGADAQEKPEPSQPRHILPTLLSRSVSKTEANKPNLKVARGIRTSQKPSQAGEARVLKPALQKLISSKSSEWRVNWKEIYQEATHRKLQKEKGMPRFGIELVTPPPPDPQGLEAEDLAHFELDEGFQWASLECDTLTLPRSVSPLSKDARRLAPNVAYPAERHDYGETAATTNHTSSPGERKKRDVGENHGTSGMNRSSEFTPLDSLVCVKTEKPDDCYTEPVQEKADHERIQSILVTQINQTMPDFPDTDTLNKNPPSSQVNELLVMSLREDELCSSLEDVDSRLLQARAALQTAFMEVQRLHTIKQQVTAEMASLRSKRIDILQRIKNSRLEQISDADSPGSDVQVHR